MALKDDLLKELDELIADGQRLDASYFMTDFGSRESPVPEVEFQTFAASARAAIDRIASKNSQFFAGLPAQFPDQLAVLGYGGSIVPVLTGALIGLRKAVDAGLLIRLENELRRNVFDDFLTQAEELLKGGYYVAASVLIGGVLEDHLRKLCDARSLTWKGDGSLNKYNDLLYSASLYGKTDLSRIQAVTHIRNDAAHGNGAAVKSADVEDALDYVRRFLQDHPG